MEALLCAVLLALGSTNPAWTGPGLDGKHQETCPLLMTPAECGQHLETLQRLSPGQAREAYLAGHHALMLDREAACRCTVDGLFPETAAIPR